MYSNWTKTYTFAGRHFFYSTSYIIMILFEIKAEKSILQTHKNTS